MDNIIDVRDDRGKKLRKEFLEDIFRNFRYGDDWKVRKESRKYPMLSTT